MLCAKVQGKTKEIKNSPFSSSLWVNAFWEDEIITGLVLKQYEDVNQNVSQICFLLLDFCLEKNLIAQEEKEFVPQDS